MLLNFTVPILSTDDTDDDRTQEPVPRLPAATAVGLTIIEDVIVVVVLSRLLTACVGSAGESKQLLW